MKPERFKRIIEGHILNGFASRMRDASIEHRFDLTFDQLREVSENLIGWLEGGERLRWEQGATNRRRRSDAQLAIELEIAYGLLDAMPTSNEVTLLCQRIRQVLDRVTVA